MRKNKIDSEPNRCQIVGGSLSLSTMSGCRILRISFFAPGLLVSEVIRLAAERRERSARYGTTAGVTGYCPYFAMMMQLGIISSPVLPGGPGIDVALPQSP